jgi:hypothetical protein
MRTGRHHRRRYRRGWLARTGGSIGLGNRSSLGGGRTSGLASVVEQRSEFPVFLESNRSHDRVVSFEVAVEGRLAVFDAVSQPACGHRLRAFGLGQFSLSTLSSVVIVSLLGELAS